MHPPEHISQGLKNIRETLRMVWNPQAVLQTPGRISADGMVASGKYDGRWEVWDTDPDGADYMVMRVQDAQGRYQPPGEWVVEWLNRWNPEHFGGHLDKMLDAYFRNAEEAREKMNEKDFRTLADAVSRWASWVALPKSGAALSYRGEREFSSQNR